MSCSSRHTVRNIPTPLLRHILPALVAFLRNDVSAYIPPQSPYSGSIQEASINLLTQATPYTLRFALFPVPLPLFPIPWFYRQ
jgi:hypothetical protein